jgi:phosphotransferase system HPr (HPr) family protein
MVGGTPPPVEIAAGAGEGIIGTDAVAVAAAIEKVASPDGVLVFMDLGSAVLSATMALEFLSTDVEVRLSDAPFVEGITAGVVLAAAGASLDEVDRETRDALSAKIGQLDRPTDEPVVAAAAAATGEISAEEKLINPDGLHSRPAATIVKTVAGFDAKVTITDLTTGKGPVSAKSLIGIMSLGAKQGDLVRISASGAQAAEAVEAIRVMAADGFGEVPAKKQ